MPNLSLDELIDGLSRPPAYDHKVECVEVSQTHISVLFFAADRVYKLKKPVDLGFLDFTGLEQRRHFCLEEVRLNRRLSPRMYLGVRAIVRGSHGLRLGGDQDDAEALEFAVEMKRLPAEGMLDRLLDRGEVDNALLDRIVGLLADFHARADGGESVRRHGTPEAVAKMFRTNLEQIESFAGDAGDADMAAPLSLRFFVHLQDQTDRFLEQHRALLDRRLGEGRVREGHGDLHAGNICVDGDGIHVYDCIEFEPSFRCGDVARDLAFLAMDLDLRGFRGFGGYLVHRYAEVTADETLETVIGGYKAHLACVRGKVNSIEAADTGLRRAERRAAGLRAKAYFNLAASYDLPPMLVVMCGLPATGKSRAAAGIGRTLGAAVLRSDVIRKQLAGVSPTAHPEGPEAADLYSSGSTRRTYTTMLEECRSYLEHGRPAIADAMFASAEHRASFLAMAAELNLASVVVYLDTPEEVVAERMRRRAADTMEISDADWSIYRQARADFQAPAELPPEQVVRATGTEDPVELTAMVLERVLGAEP